METERGSTHAAARALVFLRSSKLIDALRRRSRIVRSNNDHRAYTQAPLNRLIVEAKKFRAGRNTSMVRGRRAPMLPHLYSTVADWIYSHVSLQNSSSQVWGKHARGIDRDVLMVPSPQSMFIEVPPTPRPLLLCISHSSSHDQINTFNLLLIDILPS